MSTLFYIKNFMKDRYVASITPTLPFGVKNVCDKIDFGRSKVIVEYGAGTGVFTQHLLRHMHSHARLIVIERNSHFNSILQKNFCDPRVAIVNDSAEKVLDTLAHHAVSEVDYRAACLFSAASDLRRDRTFSGLPRPIKLEMRALPLTIPLTSRPLRPPSRWYKSEYNAHENVAVAATIRNSGSASTLRDITARISVVNGQGSSLFIEDRAIQAIGPLETVQLNTAWSTAVNPKGQNSAKLEVLFADGVASTSAATFAILGTSARFGVDGLHHCDPQPGKSGYRRIGYIQRQE